MKTNHTKENSAQNWKDTNRRLKNVRFLIKKESTRELGYELLSQIEKGCLTPKQKVESLYINARYHICCFKEDSDITHLEWANDFLDDMVAFAYDKKVHIVDLKFIFSRAHVKFQLAQLIWDNERKPWLLDKAKHITETNLRFNPENESFLWLKNQLSV